MTTVVEVVGLTTTDVDVLVLVIVAVDVLVEVDTETTGEATRLAVLMDFDLVSLLQYCLFLNLKPSLSTATGEAATEVTRMDRARRSEKREYAVSEIDLMLIPCDVVWRLDTESLVPIPDREVDEGAIAVVVERSVVTKRQALIVGPERYKYERVERVDRSMKTSIVECQECPSPV